MSQDYELQRADSLCSPSPQTKLLYALECQDFEKFEKTLKTGLSNRSIELNYVYDEPHCKNILEIACSCSRKSKFVESLIKNGVNVNSVNKFTKRSALHYAVEFSDIETIKSVIDNKSTDVNIRDSSGNTPLHLAALCNKVTVINVLLKHPSIKVNEINRKHQTALHIAAGKAHQECVLALLKNIDVDLDELRDFKDQSAREMIKNKLPNIELEAIKGGVSKEIPLFALLRNGDIQAFKSQAKGRKNQLDEDDGRTTYLQYACENGLLEVVQFLLDNGVNPNKTCAGNHKYPIMIAGFQGYIKIIQTLAEHGKVIFDDVDDGTVLHAILNGIIHCTEILGASAELRSHTKCIEYLLNNVTKDTLDVNYQDVNGDTALHLATRINDPSIVRLLLDHGAYVGYQNELGDMPISYMQAKMFKNFLDSCITTNDKRAVEEDYRIIYNYQFLAPPKLCVKHELGKVSDFTPQPVEGDNSYDVISETAPLVEMSKVAELRPFLKHPVLTSFLNLKWYTIRKYFWVNLSFYIVFWALLTAYILSVYAVPRSSDPLQMPENFAIFRRVFWFPTFVFCGLLLFRELFQFSISPRKYFRSFENFLEVGIILCTFTVLFCYTGCQSSKAQFAAVAILLSWTELVLLIGRHPLLSTNIEMFKVVCVNFLKLLSWYSILILAFSLSFYLLFRNDSAPTDPLKGDDEQFFQDPVMSIFKSVIMLTGEFDAGSIPFGVNPGTSHLLFILFVFLIAIVLFNLLNGLAVSDTQAIKSDAELVGNVCRAKLITYIEQMAIGDPFPCLNFLDKLTCLCCCVPIRRSRRAKVRHIKLFYSRINLFPKILPDLKANVYPNKGNTVEFPTKRQTSDSECFASCRNCTTWHIDPEIMKTARNLLQEKDEKPIQFPDYSDIMRRYSLQLEEYRLKLASLEDTSRRTQRQLTEVIALLKQKL